MSWHHRAAPHPRRTNRGWGVSTWLATGLALLGLLFVGTAQGSLTASVRNTGSTGSTGSLQLAGLSGATTECATTIATPSAPCTGTLASNALAAGTTQQSQQTTIADTGTLTPTTTTLTEGTCGPIPLLDSRTTTDPMLIRGGLTDATSSTFADGAGVTLDGSTGYASDVVATNNPQNVSEAIWFRTATAGGTTGGTLFGFADTPGLGSASSDRMLWLDNAGKLVFGYSTTTSGVSLNSELTSTAKYNDGAWHLAVATLTTVTLLGLAGPPALYVDGSQVAAGTVAVTVVGYSGYWHAGWDNETTGWTDPPTTPYLAGSLTDAAIFPTLSQAQITTLAGAGSQATWNADVAGGNGVPAATHSWQLGDPPTGIYTGSPTWYAQTPCSRVDATVGVTAATVTCVAPTSATPCAAPTAGVTLASLSGLVVALPRPTPTRSDALTITTARDATATATALVGLHLNFAETLTATAGTFAATLSWPAAQNIASL